MLYTVLMYPEASSLERVNEITFKKIQMANLLLAREIVNRTLLIIQQYGSKQKC